MDKYSNELPSLSSKTFKLMEVEGKPEIFAQDFHSTNWNDGKEDFGVNKINQLADTSKEQTNTINELIKRIQQLEEDSKKDIYYEGEYKWMPTTVTSMPKGWKKANVAKWLTLVVGDEEGLAHGAVQKHKHLLWAWTEKESYKQIYRASLVVPPKENYIWTEHMPHDFFTTDWVVGEDNLPAGIKAQLWQYDPNGTFTKLREEAIKNQKLKEELENKKVEKEKINNKVV